MKPGLGNWGQVYFPAPTSSRANLNCTVKASAEAIDPKSFDLNVPIIMNLSIFVECILHASHLLLSECLTLKEQFSLVSW